MLHQRKGGEGRTCTAPSACPPGWSCLQVTLVSKRTVVTWRVKQRPLGGLGRGITVVDVGNDSDIPHRGDLCRAGASSRRRSPRGYRCDCSRPREVHEFLPWHCSYCLHGPWKGFRWAGCNSVYCCGWGTAPSSSSSSRRGACWNAGETACFGRRLRMESRSTRPRRPSKKKHSESTLSQSCPPRPRPSAWWRRGSGVWCSFLPLKLKTSA